MWGILGYLGLNYQPGILAGSRFYPDYLDLGLQAINVTLKIP